MHRHRDIAHGAAIRDILRVLKRRFAGAHVQVYPVKVQGEGAAKEIAAALAYFSRTKFAEVVILARGGGSLEDLWAFNEEIVARAIAACEIAVISGVGHEVDFTIADFVADLRAPTPSAAAEIVVRSRQEFDHQIATHQRHLAQQMRYLLSQRKHRVRDLQMHRGFRQMEMLVRRRHQQLDELSSALGITLRLKLGSARQRLARAGGQIGSFDLRGRAATLRRRVEQRSEALRTLLDRALVVKRHRYEKAKLQLDERSPLALLERGYAIAYDASGKVLRSADQVAIGEDTGVRLARGSLDATVRRKRER